MYTVGDLAGMAGISSRTLRHYDKIGLLRPEHRTLSGYRMYTSEDAVRLQQILLFRELEFSLVDIARLMMEEQKAWEPEAERRWGNTDAYRVSRERTRRMTREDWSRIKERQADDLNALAALFREAAAPENPRVQELVGRARSLIDETFYPCSWEMFRGLGEMYEADPRFAAYYERIAEGLSGFYSKAIKVRCDAEETTKKT